ncbi:hypothetical protein LJY25_17710 [Hymenobacter sp. BT175]|uniref:hypothetical protein n=1 Tax=Hymenobacter translucens TaxID=2886507 RepID=UPI001D0DFF1F|nr:hypothetical protein [Hymenobacter translucens]MCC2548290.1 hypothetical protein [Hymenobacter translucens]
MLLNSHRLLIILTALLICFGFKATAQTAPAATTTISLSPEDQERGLNGVQRNFFFRTSSEGEYQNAGYFGQRLRPYLAGDEDALNNLNNYRRQKWLHLGERVVFISSVLVYSQQVLAKDEQQYFNSVQKVAVGVAVTSLLSNVFITRNTNNHMIRAVEAHNGSLPAARRVFQRLAPTGVGLAVAPTGQPQLALRWSLR